MDYCYKQEAAEKRAEDEIEKYEEDEARREKAKRANERGESEGNEEVNRSSLNQMSNMNLYPGDETLNQPPRKSKRDGGTFDLEHGSL